MSKTNMQKSDEFLKLIDELNKNTKKVIKTLEKLSQVFDQENEVVENTPSSQVDEVKQYSKEDVRGLLAAKSAAGFGKEVKAILAKYGCSKLSDVQPNDYAAVYAEAEAINHD